jgi:hypothetical protein
VKDLGLFGSKKVDVKDLGKPAGAASGQKLSLPFGDLGVDGVNYFDESLNDTSSDITESANTGANTDENWIKITNTQYVARFFRKGITKMLAYISTSAPAQITTGELSIWIANADDTKSKQLHRMDLAEFDTLSNQRNALYMMDFPLDIALPPQYKLYFKVKSSSTLATANSQISLKKVRKANNVTLADFKDAGYGGWLTI